MPVLSAGQQFTWIHFLSRFDRYSVRPPVALSVSCSNKANQLTVINYFSPGTTANQCAALCGTECGLFRSSHTTYCDRMFLSRYDSYGTAYATSCGTECGLFRSSHTTYCDRMFLSRYDSYSACCPLWH